MPGSKCDFEIATDFLVQAIGTEYAEDNCLKAARSLASGENYEPFHLVTKREKKKFVLFKSTDFFPTDKTIQMILEKDSSVTEDKVEKSETTLGSVKKTWSFDAKGTVSLAFLHTGVVGAVDKNSYMKVIWGDVKEEKLNTSQLEAMLQNRKVNMNHKLIREVKGKGGTLCIIVATYKNKEKAEITRFDKTGGSAHANIRIDAGVTIGVEGGSVIGSMSLFGRQSTTVHIDPNKPIAYMIREILVRHDGSIELQSPGCEGGFQKDPCIANRRRLGGARHANSLLTPYAIKKCLQPLLTLSEPDLTSLRTSLIELLKVPEVLSSLNITFQEVCDYLTAGEVGQEKTREELLESLADDLEGALSEEDGMQATRKEFLESLGTDDIECFKPLLEITGFVFKEDMIIYPTSDEKNILKCSSDLLDSLTSLDEDQRGIFDTSYSEKEKQEMMEMVENGHRLRVTDVRGNHAVETPHTKLSLLLRTDDNQTREIIMEKLLVAMCALW